MIDEVRHSVSQRRKACRDDERSRDGVDRGNQKNGEAEVEPADIPNQVFVVWPVDGDPGPPA